MRFEPQGSLIAMLPMELLRQPAPQAQGASLRIKALRPSFDGQALRVHGTLHGDVKSVRVWAQHPQGWLAMDAMATLR